MSTRYDEIELTQEEIEAALLEARKKKWFHLRAVAYWAEQKQNGVDAHEEAKRIKREKAALKRQLSCESRARTDQGVSQ